MAVMDLRPLQELADQQTAARESACDYARRVRAALGERLAWIRLYGSLARGDWMGPDESDVDVAVVIREKADADVRLVLSLASAQLYRDGFVFSPRVFSPEEFQRLVDRELRLGRDIIEEGILL
jgi:predicted nucleotidyltransferase